MRWAPSGSEPPIELAETMTFLPILERELRGRARGWRTYWTRSGLALVGVLICLPQLVGSKLFGGATGPETFTAIAVTAFFVCCCGCLVTADVVGAERREGTLGLLLLTRVSALDLLWGKFGASGVTGFCALAAFSPLLTIPILGGGVTGGEAFRCGLALANTLFLSLAVGLFTSVWRQVSGLAVAWAAGLMAVLVALPWGGTWLPANIRPEALLKLKLASPLAALAGGRDYPYHTDPAGFWLALLAVQCIAWLILAAAIRGLRRSLRRESQASEQLAAATARPAPPFRIRDTAPIAWLVESQQGIKRALWIVGLTIPLLQWAQLLVGKLAGAQGMVYSSPLYLVLNLVTSCLLAWVGSHFFIQARRSGALELLLATPVGAQTVLSGQLTSLRRLMGGPLLVMLSSAVAIHFAYPFLALSRPSLPPWSVQAIVAFSLGVTSLLLELLALLWVGLWFGLTARNQTSAIFWTVGLAEVAIGLVRMLATVGLHTWLPPSPPSPPSLRDYLLSYGLTGLILLLRLGLSLYARSRVVRRLNIREPLD